MSQEDSSETIGHFLAEVVARNACHDIYGVRFGRGRPQRNWMAKNRLWEPGIHPDIAELHRVVQKWKLDQDPEFMIAITKTITACCEAPIHDLLARLEEQQRDSGDIGFRLIAQDGGEVNIEQVKAAFTSDEDRLLEKELTLLRLGIDWPRNPFGLGACGCCGFHTVIEGPCSFQECPVCNWLDVCDVEDPWNTAKWGQTEDPWADLAADERPEWKMETVQQARDHFERGVVTPHRASFRRQPMDMELPRYDWAKDSRPH